MAKNTKSTYVTPVEILKTTVDPLPNPLLPGKPLPPLPLVADDSKPKKNPAVLERSRGFKTDKAKAKKRAAKEKPLNVTKVAKRRWAHKAK
ncbi:hypothetical protein W02_17950 [Nitrospira sp. KM1]|uniref:hypothetical protein n=1 Tax=Nitrospira sp. KM1 TaxID=1936990 RepID=UPI0013A70D8D|nr:hypothetical protein [Nitrospira sp. KM1]BCA54655.1 hypothetical protein W02_17950 [Nitrospira sp. KM1]